MYLNASIAPSRHWVVIQCVFVLAVLLLALFAQFVWWQLLLLVLLALGCLLFQNKLKVQHIHVDNPKELWQLNVEADENIYTVEAYLNDICLMDFGFFTALKLKFYSDEADFAHQTVFLFEKNLQKADFRKLTTLAKFAGY